MRRPHVVAAIAIAALTAVAGCGTTVHLGAAGAGLGDGSLSGISSDLGGQSTTAGIGATTAATAVPTGQTSAGEPTAPPTAGASDDVTPPTTGGATSSAVSSTAPISLGFVTTATSNSHSLGLTVGTTITDQQIYTAIVNYYNTHGGIDGHKIAPVYAYTDTGGSDWPSEFQAACDTFTEDHHVSAVLGYVFAWYDSFEQCLEKANIVHVNGAFEPGDLKAQAADPDLVASSSPSVDATVVAGFQGGLSTGLISPKSKLGVFLDTCAHSDRAWTDTAKPWLTSHGIPFDFIQTDCDSGASGASGTAADASGAVVRFKSEGIKTVVAEGAELLLFMETANTQGYHPQYVTSIGGAAVEGLVPAQQLDNLHGFGWLPYEDMDPANASAGSYTPAQKACLRMLAAGGLQPKEYNDFVISWITCDSIGLYAKAYALTGGSTSPSQLVAGMLKVMPTFAAASPDGGALTTATGHGGPARYREWSYVSSCSCFRESGPYYPMPQL